MNKLVFKTKTKEGDEIELAVQRPSWDVERQADLELRKAFRYYVEQGLMLRERLESYLRSQNLWDDEKQSQKEELENTIRNGAEKLEAGGMKLSEAKQIAIDMRVARIRLNALIAPFTTLDNNSVQGQAENRKFDYLVSACTVYNDSGKTYFQSLKDYNERAEETAAFDAATHFAQLFYGYNDEFEKNLPENKFLLKFKLCDDNLRLINKDGHYVDADGKLIDKDFNYITADGKKCTRDGKILEEKKEPSPFLDEDGNPIVI